MGQTALQITHSEPVLTAVGRDVPVSRNTVNDRIATQLESSQHPLRLQDAARSDPSSQMRDRVGGRAAMPERRRSEQEGQGYGTYLYGSIYSDPALAASGEGPPPNWSSYTGSRIAARIFSRGVMGTTFYTLANQAIPKQLRTYKATGSFDKTKPLQWIARGFDIAYGKPKQAYVKQYYKWKGRSAEEAAQLAREATTYRTRKQFGVDDEYGRSLGAEIVAMTFDFAAGSTGDAWGRQIANMADPNIHNSWVRDDGSWDYRQFASAVTKNAWRIFSKNQGEDWFAGIFYIPQMRFQRNFIDKLYPGFRVSSDHQLNGGSWVANASGKITGSLAKAGALDLQLRFTGYNVYTLMYRDLYDKIDESITRFREGESQPSLFVGPDGESAGLLGNLALTGRYIAKSAIKATIFMTPAVPFFWATRTPQAKPNGFIIPVMEDGSVPKQNIFPPHPDPFNQKHTHGLFDKVLNPAGKICHSTTQAINRLTNDRMPAHVTTGVNAFYSYTPYMIAKTETAIRWDRPKGADGLNGMDRSIYRFLDGMFGFNLGEVKAGFNDIREQIIHPPSNRAIEASSKNRSDLTYAAARDDDQKTVDSLPQTQVRNITRQGPRASYIKPNERGLSWQARKAQEEFLTQPLPGHNTVIH